MILKKKFTKKFEIFENCKNSKINKSIFQLLHKLEGFIYHNFLRIDRKGTITILTTNQNIWPYDDLVYNLMIFFSNFHSIFSKRTKNC